MTCIHIAVFAPEPALGFPQVSASRPGPRSPRTPWPSRAAYGPVISTETSWMRDSSTDTALRDLMDGRLALIEELAQLRKAHKATSSVMDELRLVTEALMQMGVR